MKLNSLTSFILALSSIILVSCGQAPPEFVQSPGGTIYKIIRKGNSEVKPDSGCRLVVMVKYEAKDTVFMDSYKDGRTLMIAYPSASYKGSLEEAFAQMREGDSAVIKVNANTFFTKVLNQECPAKVSPNEPLTFYITLKEIISQSELEQKQNEVMAQMQEMAAKRKGLESQELEEYLTTNKITAKPLASGLYYIETKKGSGAKPEKGATVKVHYTGKLLDGTVFDSSVDRGEPIELPIGVGQVIPGWDEGIMLMNEGAKGLLVIPSALAYGEQGAPPVIPPYSALVFEVELVKAK